MNLLSRTADSLFWFSRYVERADYLARMLEAAMRLSSLPTGAQDAENEWDSALATAGCWRDLHERSMTAYRRTKVTRFLALRQAQPDLDPQLPARSRAPTPARCAPP